ncbi:mechanosensitive ion channel family protein [Hydrogenimonas sp.]
MRNPLFLLFFMAIVALWGGEKSPSHDSSANGEKMRLQKAPEHYTPEEIPNEAVETAKLLDDIRKNLKIPPEILEIESVLPDFIRATREVRNEIARHDLTKRKSEQLRKWYEESIRYRQQLETYADRLERQIDLYNDMLKSLQGMLERWKITYENARRQNAPEAILQRARETIGQIETVQRYTKNLYDETLTHVDRISEESLNFEALTTALEEAIAKRGMELLTLDHPPIFETLKKRGFHLSGYLHESLKAIRYILEQTRLFYTTNIAALYAHIGTTLFLGFLLLYLHLRHRRGRLFPIYDEQVRNSLFFLEHPIAATVLLSILVLPLFYPERPISVGYLNAAVALGALLVIVHDIVVPPVRGFVYLLTTLFLLTAVQIHIVEAESEARVVWLLMALLLLWASLRMLRREGPLQRKDYSGEIRFFTRFAPLVPLILVVSIGANVVGAVNLSVKLLASLITSLYLFTIFLIVARIFRGLIVMFVRRRSLESKHLLQAYSRQIQSYLIFLVNLFLMLYWLYLVFKQFDLLYYLENRWQKLMAISWQIGEVVVSVGALVDFLFVLVVTWFLTRFITIVLDLELFSRYEFPRGVPAAIRMIVRYLIITAGVVFALTVLGIRLTDLSLIAGALGVGIGFGLRNIMANFVSGLLLIFERPVQQGDVVEVGGVFGDVQKIGVRATTIKTYDGSEVIVPNADFITKEVTNWTLSSKSRRVKMRYKVAFGNDPRKVIEIIREAIAKHPDIRKDPAPKILFDGYGDYYLEFTVYFWVDGRLLDIKSETALNIYEALTEAGIEMPVPFSRVSYHNQEEGKR